MDANFTFPRPQAPIPRKKSLSSLEQSSRESSALRASVLDVALELGIGNNSIVTNWMFDNTLQEEEEEEETAISPGLTQGESATSEGSSSSRQPSTPSDSNHSSSSYAILPSSGRPIAGWNPSKISYDIDIPYLPNEGFGDSIKFPLSSQPAIPIPPRPITPTGTKKLRKKLRTGDGHESDGGHISDGGKRRDVKKDKKASDDLEKKNLKARAKEEKEVERKRKKSLTSAAKASKKSSDKESTTLVTGYETDGAAASSSKSPFKSKSKIPKSKGSADKGGYETDGADHSANPNLKKSKTRFFKLGSKSSRPDLREDIVQAPVVDKEIVPLPIAERFATSLGALAPSSASLKLSSPTTLYSDSLKSSTSERPDQLQTQSPLNPYHLPLIATTQPLTFEAAAPSASASSFQSDRSKDRSSQSSAESSSSKSSGHKRQGLQFTPSREGHSLGFGSIESYATITSASHSSHSHVPVSPPTSAPVEIQLQISSLPYLSTQNSTPLKPPPISFPITRSASPMSPVAPLNINKNHNLTLPQLQIQSRGPSPSPLSPHSPYVMVTPTLSSPQVPVSNLSLVPIAPRPRNPPIEGFGPRPTFISLPSTANGRLSPAPPQSRQPSPHLSIIPSSNYIVPSPGGSPLPSPNVLAYYDIPPPSPPPVGPLPNVPLDGPPPLNLSAGAFPPSSHLRSKVLERQRSGHELSVLFNQIQRGREAPFPSRPVAVSNATSTVGHIPGLEARAKVPRYKDFYSHDPPLSDQGHGVPSMDQKRWSPAAKVEGNWVDSADTQDDQEEEEEDMHDVLDRFADSSFENNASETRDEDHRVLDSRRSFEALRDKHESFAISDYYGTRETIYSFDDTDKRNRESRWSGSIYSRMSILDPDKSEETRDRFVKRVEAMLETSREKERAIPPVPRIPEGLANSNNWNKF